MTSDSKTSRAFRFVAWGVWFVGPVGTEMTLQPTYSAGSSMGMPAQPDPVVVNAAALVVLLVAASQWDGWRYRPFRWLLGYYCLLALRTMLWPCLSAEDDALAVLAGLLVIATLLCTLAFPFCALLTLIKEKDASWRAAVVADANADRNPDGRKPGEPPAT